MIQIPQEHLENVQIKTADFKDTSTPVIIHKLQRIII